MLKRVLTLNGLPVVDAHDPVYIQVIKRDVRAAGRRSPEDCALAIACKRELGCDDVKVYLSRIYIKRRDHWDRYQLSESARSEIKMFDKYGGFSEGVYMITPPQIRPYKDPSERTIRDTNNAKPRGHRQMEGVRLASPLAGGAVEHPPKQPA